jgi:hypothetical protein
MLILYVRVTFRRRGYNTFCLNNFIFSIRPFYTLVRHPYICYKETLLCTYFLPGPFSLFLPDLFHTFCRILPLCFFCQIPSKLFAGSPLNFLPDPSILPAGSFLYFLSDFFYTFSARFLIYFLPSPFYTFYPSILSAGSFLYFLPDPFYTFCRIPSELSA